ncbi:MAG: hypothetical protein DDT37_01550 [Firmicutes bacterium]|nr:hypothetical protein [candidate division NPL-UPA2 bacterium]MBT9154642.1 hypothetical protein [candidate division NPL-UPA2 bacterium]MBT9156563.1 hypothetical protein [candidate division NPL-UPA2 bacterium]
MTLFFEYYHRQLNKWGEELCGDNVQIARTPEGLIAVVADGLGSGVQASILSTLTAKIAVSMLAHGADTEEVISTIALTLPVCRRRGLAYSTINVLRLSPQGDCYLAEFDCPETMVFRRGKLQDIERVERMIGGKRVKESFFSLVPGDMVFLISDGVIHAGVGASLNMGWQWANVAAFVSKSTQQDSSLRAIVSALYHTCRHLYVGKPGDDTTILGIRAREPEPVYVLTGPPKDRSRDTEIVRRFVAGSGRKVICGGSTAQLVARERGLRLDTELDTMDDAIPPIANMKEIDLVTEGLLTLSAALTIIRTFAASQDDLEDSALLKRSDGASRLANLLLMQATHIHFMVGTAVNTAHLDYTSSQVSARRQLISDLTHYLQLVGKEVTVEYF